MKIRKANLFLMAYACSLVLLAAVGYTCAGFSMRADDEHKALIQEAKAHTDVTFVDLPPLNLMIPSFHGEAWGRCGWISRWKWTRNTRLSCRD